MLTPDDAQPTRPATAPPPTAPTQSCRSLLSDFVATGSAIYDPPACLLDLGAALADAVFEATGPAERLAALIQTAQAEGMDPVPLTRIARYVRVSLYLLRQARETGFEAADAAVLAEITAHARYVEGHNR